MANRIKSVIDSLIDREQCGFVTSHSPIDNILEVHEIVHSINQDKTIPSRMLIKVDIEETYDTLSWDVILATLVRMNFPVIWISYIKACFNATSFSLLINGFFLTWFHPSRGVKQETPFSLSLHHSGLKLDYHP